MNGAMRMLRWRQRHELLHSEESRKDAIAAAIVVFTDAGFA
jgi:hypothetical protein